MQASMRSTKARSILGFIGYLVIAAARLGTATAVQTTDALQILRAMPEANAAETRSPLAAVAGLFAVGRQHTRLPRRPRLALHQAWPQGRGGHLFDDALSRRHRPLVPQLLVSAD